MDYLKFFCIDFVSPPSQFIFQLYLHRLVDFCFILWAINKYYTIHFIAYIVPALAMGAL